MANNNSLTTDLNTSPYYDDFDPTKNYVRILFKPSLAVQARELTQLQTALQKQIDYQAEHLFAEGAIIKNGKINVDFEVKYVKINDVDTSNNSINLSELVGMSVTSANTGVKAIVVDYADGSESSDPYTKMLFIKYQSASVVDGTTKTFDRNENIVSNNGVSFTVFDSNTCIGNSVQATITDGVLFAKDHFIYFPAQSLIIDKFANNPTTRVGFDLVESIVNSDGDSTLLDPASGTTNYAAPGADRIKITPVLTAYDDPEDITDDFIELVNILDGVIQTIVDKTEYSVIADEFARRTYDESGNYFVRGLTINMREHLNDGTNFGLYSSADGGNSSLLAIGAEPGKAYVYGYEVEKLVTQYIPVEKGIDFKDVESQNIAANYGNYLLVKEFVGSPNLNSGVTVNLYDAYERRITQNEYSSTSPSGNLLGTAILKSIEYQQGTPGANTATYRAYLTNINMSNGSISSVKSIYYNNSTTADVCMDVITPVLQEKAFGSHVYVIPTSNTRRLRDEDNQIETSFTFKKSFDVSIATTGTFTINTGAADEIYPFGAGALNATQKNTNFILSLNTACTVAMTGTISGTSGQTTVSGSGTTFTNLNVGDKITVSGQTRKIVSITSNIAATVDVAWSGTFSGSSFVKQYLVGDIINLNGKGGTGTVRTVTINSSTSAAFDLKETLSTTISATVITNLSKTNAKEIKKVLRKNRLVQINCSTAGVNGPWNLGFSDVVKINSVRKKTGANFASATEGTDVTSLFKLDNGQKDDIYEHAKLRKNYAGVSVGSTDRLLVNLDYFYHDTSQGVGFFSVDSYPIDDINGAANNSAITTADIPLYTSPITGFVYNLRDSIDTRNSKVATASDATTIGAMSTNPATTNSLIAPVSGIHTATPNESFLVDYSYYLPRKDLIVIDKKGIVKSVRGIPSLTPSIPEKPNDAMAFAELEVAPYPSLPPSLATAKKRPEYANKLRNIAIKRYTMEQIGLLEKRIENLEYYTALNFLEKATLDLKVLDDQGLDRFKNGILVDPFDDHSIGDTSNPDYNVAVDRKKSEIRPTFELGDFGNMYTGSTGTVKTGNLITMPYTHSLYISQPYAVTARNAAGLFYTYQGSITLNPESDYWTNTTQVPDLQITNDTDLSNWQNVANAWGTDWGDWETNWTSTSVSSTTGQVSSTTTGGGLGSTATTTTTTTTQVATTTTSQSRTGTQLNVSSSTTTQNYGDRVIDTSVVPFMRSRSIQFAGHGFKPNTRLYASFDGEPVVNYITPTNSSFKATAAKGSVLQADNNGDVYGIFLLPNDSTLKFRTGTKLFRLNDNAQGLTDQGLSTTYGEAAYTASGLNQTKQGTIVSTVVATVTPVTVYDDRTQTSSSTSTNVSVSTNVVTPVPTPPDPVVVVEPPPPTPSRPSWTRTPPRTNDHNDPIAQTFSVKVPQGIPGAFFTRIDLFFATKHPTYGVEIEIRELNSGGYLTKNVVPYSKIRIPSANINVSANGSLKTTITFPAPIFLLADTDYAFVVRPEANNSMTTVWVSKLGQKDLLTGYMITSQPYTGVLFASSNDAAWEPIQDEDIKFNLYRASFTTGYGTAMFANESSDYLDLSSSSGNFSEVGEQIRGNVRATVTGVSGGSIANTDIVVGATSGTRGTVYTISGSAIRLKNVSVNKDFTANEIINVLYANNTPKGVTGQISSMTYPIGYLTDYSTPNSTTIKMEVLRTNNIAFSVNEEIRGQTSNNYAVIAGFDDKKMNLINVQSSEINLSGTSIEWLLRTTSNTFVLDSNYVSIQHNQDYNLAGERVVMSKTNELNEMGGQKSVQLRSRLYTATNYISPVVDASRSHSIYVHNIVNNDATDEDNKSGGNAITKYISQKVTLAEGQDAEDIKVYITGYRPNGTDIKVYLKALNAGDSDTFNDIEWVPLDMTSKDLYSSTENIDDFKEFEYSIPDTYMTGPEGEFQYINSAGVTFTSYKYFSIKIVLLSNNSHVVPRCRDMRGICLQI